MSTINVTNLSGRGGATPNLPDGANITGVATATTFSGTLDGSLKSTGTPTLGLGVTINASGLHITGVTTVGVVTGGTFYGDGTNLTGVGETVAPWYYNPDVSQVDTYVDTGIGITFNKKIVVGSGGSMTLRLVGASGTVVQNWGITSVTVPDATSFNASLASDLVNNTTYHLSIDDGFFKDTNGTSYVGTAYTFDTSGSVNAMMVMGRNENGDLGQNNRTNYSSPIQIPGTIWGNMIDMGRASSDKFTGAIRTDGTLWTWGVNDYGQLGQNNTSPGGLSSPVQVPGTTWSSTYGTFSGGYMSMCAIKTDGTLWTWGNNQSGDLGQNSTTNYSSPVQIPGTTWSRVIYDGKSGLANKTDGTLWGWGKNDNGQLGQNNRTTYSSPIQIPGTNWAAGKITMGTDIAGAIKTDGTLWMMGFNQSGAMGINQPGQSNIRYSSPVQVPGTTWATIVTGQDATYGSKTDGTLWSWGYGPEGDLGLNGPLPTKISSPTQIPGTTWSTEMHDYAAGPRTALAVKQDGTLWVWGSKDYGMLGMNDQTQRSSPIQIPGLSGVNQVVRQSDYAHGFLFTDTTP